MHQGGVVEQGPKHEVLSPSRPLHRASALLRPRDGGRLARNRPRNSPDRRRGEVRPLRPKRRLPDQTQKTRSPRTSNPDARMRSGARAASQRLQNSARWTLHRCAPVRPQDRSTTVADPLQVQSAGAVILVLAIDGYPCAANCLTRRASSRSIPVATIVAYVR